MRISLFPDKKLEEDHLSLSYRQMTPHIEKILETAGGSSMTTLQAQNTKGEKVFITLDDVLYFEAVDRKTFAYTSDTVFELGDTLGSLEEIFADAGYIRISKSAIINIYRIRAIKPEVNMRVRAVMDNGEHLIINRNYKKAFQQYLKERRPSS